MNFRFLIYAGIFLYPFTGYSQSPVEYSSYWENYLIHNLTMEENALPSEAVYHALQTSDGFIWIICGSGLVRYDGVTTRMYNSTNTPSYNGSTIYEMHEDSKGNFWLATLGEGLVHFKDNTFNSYEVSAGFNTNLVKSIAISKGDTIWTGTYGGGLQAFYEDSVVASYTVEDGLAGNEIWKVIIDRKNRVWVGTDSGLSVLDKNTITNFTTGNGLPFNVIRGLTEMANGDVWVGTDKEGIVIFDDLVPVKYYTQKDGLGSNNPLYFAQNPADSSVWIASYGSGVDRYYSGEFDLLNSEKGLVSDLTTFVYFADNDLALVGSESGISILRKRKIDVVNRQNGGLSSNHLINVNQDSAGTIWVGTEGKGFNFKKEKGWGVIEYPPSLTNGYASGAAADRDGNLWFNTKGTGVVKISNAEVVESYTISKGLADDFVRGIAFDEKNNAWMGTNNGISVLNQNGDIRNYTIDDGLPNDFITNVLASSDGSVWAATYGGGLLRFRDSTFVVYDTSNGLLTNNVYTLHEGGDGSIWISGSDGGLSRFKDEKLRSYYIDDGLPGFSFSAIIEDDYGALWLGNSDGIFKIRIEDITGFNEGLISEIPFVHYSREDGLASQTMEIGYTSTATKLNTGEILFTTQNGLTVINPLELAGESPPVKTYINQVLVDTYERPFSDGIIVQPDERRIEISYSAFNFQSPSKTRFRVKLSNVDDDWVDMENRTTVYYDFLPHGDYTFAVAATNADGQWKYETAGLSLRVLPPFYQSWWFNLLMVLAFSGIIAGSVRLRYKFKMKELNREIAVQQKIQNERERISRDLHDNVGSHITNLITGLEISNLHITNNQNEEAVTVIQSLDIDARGAMTDLRETIWLLDQDKVWISDFEQHVKKYLKQQEYSLNGLRVIFKNTLPVDIELSPSQSLNLLRIIQEALNNCKKHAQAKNLYIIIYLNKGILKTLIEDDGVGMNIDLTTHDGNGLKNIERRTAEMAGSFRLESKEDSGTKITVTFPIIP